MNEMSISTWLRNATRHLKDIGIASARLDAELILSHTLRKPRTYLHAHLDENLDPRRLDIANARLELRKERTPLAYITGHKDFYGRRFSVNPSVLIPRPESEDMIAWLLDLTATQITPERLIDIGTGSGCLGITAKLERPLLDVTLTDLSSRALAVAQKNADTLGAEVQIRKDNLLDRQGFEVNFALANLPYVDRLWTDTSPELFYEPADALYAEEHGLRLIRQLIPQLARWLAPDGIALLEADPTQHQAISAMAETVNMPTIGVRNYIIGLRSPAN